MLLFIVPGTRASSCQHEGNTGKPPTQLPWLRCHCRLYFLCSACIERDPFVPYGFHIVTLHPCRRGQGVDYQQVFQVKNEGSWRGKSAQSLFCASHRCGDLWVSLPVCSPLLPSCAEHSPGQRVSTEFPWHALETKKKKKKRTKATLKV